MNPDSEFASCLNKQASVEKLFRDCTSADQKYQKIIAMGRELPNYPSMHKTAQHIVLGCQSVMYLYSYLEQNKVRFLVHTEALISAGLAALLILAYDNESPQVILKCPPRFLDTIGLQNLISPSRANGLSSLFLKMKQESIRYLNNN
jgi:cysteine desulfuration protein SufE